MDIYNVINQGLYFQVALPDLSTWTQGQQFFQVGLRSFKVVRLETRFQFLIWAAGGGGAISPIFK
jgi:hypothetical protein